MTFFNILGLREKRQKNDTELRSDKQQVRGWCKVCKQRKLKNVVAQWDTIVFSSFRGMIETYESLPTLLFLSKWQIME